MRKLLLIVFILLGSSLFALEIDASYFMGNLIFPGNYSETSTAFSGKTYPWGISIGASHRISDKLDLKAGFLDDPILRNMIYTEFQYSEDYFSIGVGPFFGAFNSTVPLLNSGISTSIKAQVPGLLFVNFRTDNSIGTRMIETGNYIQTRNEISFGFYVPHAICTLYLDSKDYVEVVSDGEIKYSSSDYIFGR